MEEQMTSLAQRTYVIGVWMLAAAVLVQFLLAGLGIFADGTFIGLHATVGAGLVGVLSLLLVGVGRIAGVAGGTLWLTAAVAGLVVVQSLLLFPYHLGAQGLLRAISGLHVLNALLVFYVALQLLQRVQAMRRLGAGPESPA
jgi:Family of unknown function (DUF6220)